MKFRIRRMVIEATQWFKNGDHPEDYANDDVGFDSKINDVRTYTGAERRANGWEGSVVRYYRRPDVPGEALCVLCRHTMHDHGWIDAPGVGHTVCPGDFIVTTATGGFYPCKPDLFQATYEPIPQS